MRKSFGLAICGALLGLAMLPSAALAQQKTVKACQDEWRAHKADNQAKGITEKEYVTQCRTGSTTAQPTPSPSAAPSPAPSASAPAQQKTIKACEDEWSANKAAYQEAKVSEKAYVSKCRAGEAVALPSRPAAVPTPAPTAPTPRTAAPAPSPPPTSPVKPSPTVSTPATSAGQFQTEAQAKSHCPTDLVVWANLTSKIYHFAGHKSYGTTQAGAYMCEKDATGHGFRASKTEKRPSA